ncbi:MAG: lipid-A-disaccharide synthase [Alphaproteobacteria bacterium]|nr:lipid-A-disaccharide synthase [Alphaproteobacteria bacterium]
MRTTSSSDNIVIIAGEPSGDMLGAALIKAIGEISHKPYRMVGVGGPQMQAAGLHSLFPLSDLTHFGLFEVVAHLPLILRRLSETIAAIRAQKPAAVITIDSPDFSFRVAAALKHSGIPLVHYVAPTVWAWRPGRAKKVAALYHHLLALFPFEPPYFTAEKLPCTFVGHSVIEGGADQGNAKLFRAQHQLGDAPLLVVLPGSRKSELKRLLPLYAQTIHRLRGKIPHLRVALPTLPHFNNQLVAWAKTLALPDAVIVTDTVAEKYHAFAAGTAALACSGTVALELALAGLPAVIAYKVHPVTALMVKRAIKVPYANLVNLMLDRMAVPELLQQFCTPQNLENALLPLLENQAARQAQQHDLAQVAAWLGAGGVRPSHRAAQVVLDVIGEHANL